MRILIYDGSVPSKGKDIYGAREGVPNCRFATDAIAVSSLDDMLQKITAKGQQVDVLTSCGHAAAGSMSVAGIINPQTQMQRENYDPKGDLQYNKGADLISFSQKLRPLLAPGAFFFLAGCEVGEGEKGGKLLLTLSQNLPNVWVVGVIADVAIVHNDEKVEVHQSINQKDAGLVEASTLSLTVVHNGNVVENDEEWPENLVEGIALWPTK